MFRRRNTETGILNNFEKILGAGHTSEQRQRNSQSFPDQRNRTNFLDAGFNGTEKYAFCKSKLHM